MSVLMKEFARLEKDAKDKLNPESYNKLLISINNIRGDLSQNLFKLDMSNQSVAKHVNALRAALDEAYQELKDDALKDSASSALRGLRDITR